MKVNRTTLIPACIGFIIGITCSLTITHVSAHADNSLSFLPFTPTPTAIPTPTPLPSPTPTILPSPLPTPKPTPQPTTKPTSTPKPTIKPFSASDLNGWFDKYASLYSIDKSRLKRIADCESHTNPTSTNGQYGGMFQYSASSWKSARRQMNKDPDPALRFDPEAAIDTAAFTLSTRGMGAWPACGKL